MSLSIGRPAEATGWNKEACLGLGHAIYKPTLEVGIETAFGTSDAARCQAIVVWDNDGNATLHRDQLVFGALEQRLTGSIDDVIVGVLGQGNAKKGFNPPWILEDASDELLKLVEDWTKAHVTEGKDGTLTFDITEGGEEEPSF